MSASVCVSLSLRPHLQTCLFPLDKSISHSITSCGSSLITSSSPSTLSFFFVAFSSTAASFAICSCSSSYFTIAPLIKVTVVPVILVLMLFLLVTMACSSLRRYTSASCSFCRSRCWYSWAFRLASCSCCSSCLRLSLTFWQIKTTRLLFEASN